MITSFIYNTDAALLCFLLFLGMLLLISAGYFLQLQSNLSQQKTGVVEGALFGLLGLILAFTFGMSGSRYESRRLVIVEEANAISTAYSRVDLYQSDSAKTALSNYFKHYINARIDNYEAGFNQQLQINTRAKADSIAKLIWNLTMQLSKQPINYIPTMQMVPALNAMVDIVTSRESSLKSRVPDSILWLMFLMILSCSFLIGFSIPINKKANIVSTIVFVLLSILVVFVILDLDRPSRGLINLSDQIQLIVDLRKMIPNT